MMPGSNRLTNSKNKQVAVKFYKQAQCVATDDPRLKETR
jgi:hypothetical protein